jgi:hypothetical protein
MRLSMLLDILEEHFDDASFLAERWLDRGASSAEHEEAEQRLRAHLDGLMLGGATAWELSKHRLAGAGDVFVAAWAALNGEPSWRQQLDSAQACKSSEAQLAVQAAQQLAGES